MLLKGRRQKHLTGYPLKGEGYPPVLLSFFWLNDFRLRGGDGVGGYPTIPLKNSYLWPKTQTLALFDPFFKENFRQFSIKGGGVTPLSAKGFLAK